MSGLRAVAERRMIATSPWRGTQVILVVGASGQLGSAVVDLLVEQGRSVRALVRTDSNFGHLAGRNGIELAFGDLLVPESLVAPVNGDIEAVVASANSVAPRRGDRAGRVEREGYPNLIRTCEQAGVGRFVYVSSVSMGDWDERVPVRRWQRSVEQELERSSLEHAILRFTMFSDVWLALPGSSVPLRGVTNPTLARAHWFLRAFRAVTGRLVERRGLMLVPGSADSRFAFITVRDVARFLVAAIDHEAARNEALDVGGPEAVSWREVAQLYARLLGREVRLREAPAGVFRAMAALLGPIDGAAANTMMLNAFAATRGTELTTPELAETLGVAPLQTVEEFLAECTSR